MKQLSYTQALEEEGRNNKYIQLFLGRNRCEEGRHSLGYDDSQIQRTKLNHTTLPLHSSAIGDSPTNKMDKKESENQTLFSDDVDHFQKRKVVALDPGHL